MRGRCLRYSDRCCCCGSSSADTVALSLPTARGAAPESPRRERIASARCGPRSRARRARPRPRRRRRSIVAGALAAAGDRRRRLRQLRHPVCARLGRTARARRDARPTGCRSRPRRIRWWSCSACCSRRSGRERPSTSPSRSAFLALSACGWVIYRLGSEWFGRAAGALAALIFLTRVPVLSYGVRAYVDIPYLLLVLWALLVETRRRRAGRARARAAGARRAAATRGVGLLRALLALSDGLRAAPAARRPERRPLPARGARARSRLALLAAAAPLVWLRQRPRDHRRSAVVADEHPPHRRHARARQRDRQRPAVHPAAHRRGAAPARARRRPRSAGCCRCCGCARARARGRRRGGARGGRVRRVRRGGLPINTRYAFLAAAILCIFCGAGVFGWTYLPRGDPRRRWWMAAGGVVLVAGSHTRPRSALRPPRTGQTGAPAADRRRPLALVEDRAIALALRAGGGAQPRARPAAGPVPEDEPARTSSAPERGQIASRHLRRPGEHRGRNATTCSTRTTRTRRPRAAGLHRGALQPLVADLRSAAAERTVHPSSRLRRRRLSPPAAPVRELPLRLPVIA